MLKYQWHLFAQTHVKLAYALLDSKPQHEDWWSDENFFKYAGDRVTKDLEPCDIPAMYSGALPDLTHAICEGDGIARNREADNIPAHYFSKAEPQKCANREIDEIDTDYCRVMPNYLHLKRNLIWCSMARLYPHTQYIPDFITTLEIYRVCHILPNATVQNNDLVKSAHIVWYAWKEYASYLLGFDPALYSAYTNMYPITTYERVLHICMNVVAFCFDKRGSVTWYHKMAQEPMYRDKHLRSFYFTQVNPNVTDMTRGDFPPGSKKGEMQMKLQEVTNARRLEMFLHGENYKPCDIRHPTVSKRGKRSNNQRQKMSAARKRKHNHPNVTNGGIEKTLQNQSKKKSKTDNSLLYDVSVHTKPADSRDGPRHFILPTKGVDGRKDRTVRKKRKSEYEMMQELDQLDIHTIDMRKVKVYLNDMENPLANKNGIDDVIDTNYGLMLKMTYKGRRDGFAQMVSIFADQVYEEWKMDPKSPHELKIKIPDVVSKGIREFCLRLKPEDGFNPGWMCYFGLSTRFAAQIKRIQLLFSHVKDPDNLIKNHTKTSIRTHSREFPLFYNFVNIFKKTSSLRVYDLPAWIRKRQEQALRRAYKLEPWKPLPATLSQFYFCGNCGKFNAYVAEPEVSVKRSERVRKANVLKCFAIGGFNVLKRTDTGQLVCGITKNKVSNVAKAQSKGQKKKLTDKQRLQEYRKERSESNQTECTPDNFFKINMLGVAVKKSGKIFTLCVDGGHLMDFSGWQMMARGPTCTHHAPSEACVKKLTDNSVLMHGVNVPIDPNTKGTRDSLRQLLAGCISFNAVPPHIGVPKKWLNKTMYGAVKCMYCEQETSAADVGQYSKWITVQYYDTKQKSLEGEDQALIETGYLCPNCHWKGSRKLDFTMCHTKEQIIKAVGAAGHKQFPTGTWVNNPYKEG